MDINQLTKEISYARGIAIKIYNDGFRLGNGLKQLYAILSTYCKRDGYKINSTIKNEFKAKMKCLELEMYR